MAKTINLIGIEDLKDLGADISGAEDETRAQKWIGFVSSYLRLVAKNNGVDLDHRLLADKESGGGVYGTTVKMVVANAVMRAYSRKTEIPDAVSYSQSATPYAESVNYGAAITPDAYFKQKELNLLGFSSISGKKQIGVLRGVLG